MKVPSNISTLVGVGSSICGGSAIAATAPVIGADDEEIAQAGRAVQMFEIEIEHMSGKEVQEK